jgi:tetratricopeptide (TPR) repeat protein
MEALAALQRAVNLDPNSPLACGNLAIVEDLLGREQDAKENHQKAIDLSKREDARWIASNSLVVSAWLLWVQGGFEKALARADMAIKSYDEYPRASFEVYLPHAVKAHLLVMAGKPEEAIPLFKRFPEVFEAGREAQAWQAQPLLAEVRSIRLRALIERALIANRDNWEVRFDERLVGSIQDTIALYPEHPSPWYLMGYVRSLQRRWDRAAGDYKKLVNLEPSSAGNHAYLAYCYKQLGRTDDCARHLELAHQQVDESEGEYKYHRACLEAVSGNKAEALELLEVALKRKHESPAWVSRDPILDPIRGEPGFKEIANQYLFPVYSLTDRAGFDPLSRSVVPGDDAS